MAISSWDARYIHIGTVSSQCLQSILLIQFNLVHGLFGRSNMHSILDFCPRPARKETQGHLTSKRFFCVFISPKKRTKNVCPSRLGPSSIYNQSIGHIFEQELFCWEVRAERKKVDLRFSEQHLRVFFNILQSKKILQGPH